MFIRINDASINMNKVYLVKETGETDIKFHFDNGTVLTVQADSAEERKEILTNITKYVNKHK